MNPDRSVGVRVRVRGRGVILVAGACIAALAMSGLTGVRASAAQPSAPTSTPAPTPSIRPTTTVPPWDATPKDPSKPVPAPPPASATKATGFDEKLSKVVEAETTPTKAVYANPDGSRTAKISISPQRFKDSTGKWVEYDLSIVNRTDGTLGARAAPQAAKLNKKADGNVATVQTTAGPVTLRHPNVSPAPAVLNKHEAKYAGALSAGRDLKIALTPDGFEESVILPDAKAPASYTDELVLPAGVTLRETEQGVELFDKAGKGIASFGGGFAHDAEFPQGAVPTPVSVRLVSQKANVASLEVSIADPTWLSAPGRSFPVTIDPTFAQFGTAPGSGGYATHVIAGTPADSRPANIAYYGGISLGAGLYNQGNKIRTLLRFDVSSIPADAVVTYAQLAMFNTYTGFSYSCIGKTVDAYALAGPFSAATTWNTQPAVSGAPVSSPAFARQPWPNGGGNYCPETWVGLPVTPIVQGWRNGANHGVELRGNEGDMGSFQHFFSSHTGQYQPYLQLNWDRVPNPPTNVVATANPDGSATVNWTLATVPPNSSAVDWYVVLALNPADLSYAGDYAVLCATCTTATLTNLAPSRTYVLGVYPHNGAGYGFAPSNQITIAPAPLVTSSITVAESGFPVSGTASGSYFQANTLYDIYFQNPDGSQDYLRSVTTDPSGVFNFATINLANVGAPTSTSGTTGYVHVFVANRGTASQFCVATANVSIFSETADEALDESLTSPGTVTVTGEDLATKRREFESTTRPNYWREKAQNSPEGYSEADLTRMRAGKAPIGADGFPMELHHIQPLSRGGSNAPANLQEMTRTNHRLGGNYR